MKLSQQHFSYCLVVLLVLVASTNGGPPKLTQKETEALKKFRPLVNSVLYKDYMKTDAYLLRWLKYFKFDLEDAADRLKNAHEWRKDNKIDTILDEDFKVFEKMFPYDMDSVDKEGRPVWISYFGKWDLRKIALGGQLAKYNRYQDYLYEKMEAKMRELDAKNPDKSITQFYLILDLQGYNLRQQACLACIPGNAHFVNSYENYHSGVNIKTFVVNTPTVFEELLELMRPLMSEQTRANLKVYGYEPEKWGKEIQKYISKAQLPEKLGGTRKTKH